MSDNSKNTKKELKVSWVGYVSLAFAILFFSGIFKNAEGPLRALDFTNVVGKFGSLGNLNDGIGTLAKSFRGKGGYGVKDGWLFALTLFPTVMFALGVVKIIEDLDGLKAGQKILTPLLKPILGLPGIAGLTLISSLQSTDAGASMTSILAQQKEITEDEKTIFCAFQFSGGGTLTNYLSSGAALFPFLGIPILIPLLVVFIFKIFGANLMRLYLKKFAKEQN